MSFRTCKETRKKKAQVKWKEVEKGKMRGWKQKRKRKRKCREKERNRESKRSQQHPGPRVDHDSAITIRQDTDKSWLECQAHECCVCSAIEASACDDKK